MLISRRFIAHHLYRRYITPTSDSKKLSVLSRHYFRRSSESHCTDERKDANQGVLAQIHFSSVAEIRGERKKGTIYQSDKKEASRKIRDEILLKFQRRVTIPLPGPSQFTYSKLVTVLVTMASGRLTNAQTAGRAPGRFSSMVSVTTSESSRFAATRTRLMMVSTEMFPSHSRSA